MIQIKLDQASAHPLFFFGSVMTTSNSNNSSTVKCTSCSRKELCFPIGLALKDYEELEGLITTRKSIKRGYMLYRSGDPLDAIFAVRLGFLKSVHILPNGVEQITGFHMAGELLGFEGLAEMAYLRDVTALEDTEVCIIPYDRYLSFMQTTPGLLENVLTLMGQEILREQQKMVSLGSASASEKVAAFLLELSQKYEARGFSKSEFVLRMSRSEIGNYLGLQLETVSRTLSQFASAGLIFVRQRRIRIVNHIKLHRIALGCQKDF